MDATEFIWMNGGFVRWEDAKVHVLTHTLHYGAGAFEGIRVYKTADGPAVFRLTEHIDRLFYSARALRMEVPYTAEEIRAATLELVAKNKLEQGYIRPLISFGYGIMGLNPRNAPIDVSLSCWPWGAYLPHETVDIKISSFIRIHPKSTVADAKLCGHYVNSIMSVLEIRDTQFHEALFLDAAGNIAEGPGENFFIVKNGELFTPKLGSILPGITRNTIMQLAGGFGIKVHETDIKPEQAYQADEAFFTGTAAEVVPIRSIDGKPLAAGGLGPITARLKSAYSDVVCGRNPEYHRFLSYAR